MIIHVAPQATIATTPDPSSPEEGTTLDVRCWHLLFGQTQGSAPTVGVVTPSKKRTPIAGSASSERFNLAGGSSFEILVSSFKILVLRF